MVSVAAEGRKFDKRSLVVVVVTCNTLNDVLAHVELGASATQADTLLPPRPPCALKLSHSRDLLLSEVIRDLIPVPLHSKAQHPCDTTVVQQP